MINIFISKLIFNISYFTDGTCLQLTFFYLISLEIVTVAIQLKPGSDTPSSCISGG